MRRLPTFIFGMLVGGFLIYTALNYHLIQAKDGVHLIPKASAGLAGTYVDIRKFGPVDWAAHPEVAVALIGADRRDLLQGAAGDALSTALERIIGPPPK